MSGNYEILSKIHPNILNSLDTIFTKLTELAIATGYSDPVLQKVVLSTKIATDIKKNLYDLFVKKKNVQKNVLELKKEIETHLRKIDFKILIIIDDIDRLTQEEIRQLFRGIKSLADFPNVIYLLAYDESVVLDALKGFFPQQSKKDQENNIDFSRNFLEKIVQFPVPLPTPEKWALSQFFETELDIIYSGTDGKYFEMKHWILSYSNGLSRFLTNPRKVKNLINSLKFLYPSVRNEVNFVDFVLLDSLRIFKPEIYSVIRENPEYFLLLPIKEAWSGGIKEDIYVQFHEKWMAKLQRDEKIPILRIVFNLFPIVADRFSQAIGLSDEIILYNKSDSLNKGRICSNEDTFSKYFRYTLQPSDISLKDLKFELTSQTDPQYYIKKFTTLIEQETDTGCTKASEYLEKLSEYLDETTPKETILAIIISFFNIGDQLMLAKDEKSNGLGVSKNDYHIMNITERGLPLINENERMQLLEKEIRYGSSLSYISQIMLKLGSPFGRFNENRYDLWQKRIVDELEFQQLEKIFMYNLQENAKKDFRLLERPYLNDILLVWRKIAPDFDQEDGFIKVPDFINNFIKQESLIIRTIVSIMNCRYSQGLDLFSFVPDLSKEEFIKIINNALDLEIIGMSEEELEMSEKDIKKVTEFLNPEK
jgi:predicted KAP-like P-loop ATPase